MEWLPLSWIFVGAILLLLEVIIPGAVLGFIGGAALITGCLIHFEYINGLIPIMMTFFVTSMVLIVTLRSALLKFFPDNSVVQNTDEVQDVVGGIVDVSEDITPYKRGRIKYLNTTWEAQSETQLLIAEQAIIVGRDGNCLIVKSL